MGDKASCCLSTHNCGVLAFQRVLGGKWKTSILWALQDAPLRFSELHRKLEGITEAMLTKQLRELEADGFVHREVYAEVPPRVEYSVTALGHKTLPLLCEIDRWAAEYLFPLNP